MSSVNINRSDSDNSVINENEQASEKSSDLTEIEKRSPLVKSKSKHIKGASCKISRSEGVAGKRRLKNGRCHERKIGEASKKKRLHKLQRKNKKEICQTNRFARRLWTEEEDSAIASLVENYGLKKWTLVSRKLKDEYGINGRSGKQCRERYF